MLFAESSCVCMQSFRSVAPFFFFFEHKYLFLVFFFFFFFFGFFLIWKGVCMFPSFRSVASRVCLAKVPFLTFSGP